MGALEVWPHSDLTCHATLQCLVALCKDNAMMKANMTVTALKPVLQVLHTCGSCSAIAERGFTLLAVLQVCFLWLCHPYVHLLCMYHAWVAQNTCRGMCVCFRCGTEV